jgi:hypothetical protein
MSKQDSQSQPQPQKQQQTVQTQPVKVEPQPELIVSKPDKNVEVPKFVALRNRDIRGK